MNAKRILSIAFLLVAFPSVFACRGASPALSAKIDQLVNTYVVDHQFMGSVLVAEKGKVLFAKGYGLANAERNIPNTPDTVFMIGSITKQFTAMLVTQLAEKGMLKLDATISDFLPDFPEDIGRKITVEMLLCHTSGLILPEGIEKYYYATTKEEFLREYLKQLSEEGLRFEPGHGYGYSNGGYYILGLIILKPLGMAHTGCDRKGRVVENMATSYRKLPDGYITWNEEMYSFDPGITALGNGNMYSTVKDLFKFSQALSTNRLLTKEFQDAYLKMRNVKSRPPLPNVSEERAKELFGRWGNGFVGEISILDAPDTGKKETFYWHDGTWKLFYSNHFHFSDKDQVVIICSNCNFLCEGDEIVLKIHQLLNDKPHDHIHFKHTLTQYLEEDIAMHAGIPAAIQEYFRLRNDTENFIVPERDYFVAVGRQVAEQGSWDDAIGIFQAVLPEFPGFWEAYDALGDTYVMKGEKELAVQSFEKSLEINPQNSHAQAMLKNLKKK
jgi:CubicO group peptidase (beta-lactamase class C family)